MLKMKLKHIEVIHLLKTQIHKIENTKIKLDFENKIHRILKATTNSFNSRWIIYKTISIENDLPTVCKQLNKLGIEIFKENNCD